MEAPGRIYGETALKNMVTPAPEVNRIFELKNGNDMKTAFFCAAILAVFMAFSISTRTVLSCMILHRKSRFPRS